MEKNIHTSTPDTDSQYRLVRCRCGHEPHYRTDERIAPPQYKVICPVCGADSPTFPARHDAQIWWNARHGENFK